MGISFGLCHSIFMQAMVTDRVAKCLAGYWLTSRNVMLLLCIRTFRERPTVSCLTFFFFQKLKLALKGEEIWCSLYFVSSKHRASEYVSKSAGLHGSSYKGNTSEVTAWKKVLAVITEKNKQFGEYVIMPCISSGIECSLKEIMLSW